MTHARGRGGPWKTKEKTGTRDRAAAGERPASVPPPAPQYGERLGFADREGFLAWVFLLPSVVYIIALVGVPFLLAIAFAFSDVTTGDPSFDFVGFRNFTSIFDDDIFWRSLVNTLISPWPPWP
jgi:multiple sugar transport system permease protein